MTLDDRELGSGVSNSTPKGVHVPGEHVAEIVSIKDAGISKYNPDKEQYEFDFNLSDGTSTRRWVNKSFGKSKLSGYSTLSRLVLAFTGIPLGDPEQRRVRFSQLLGKRATVITELSDEGYPRIVEFKPLDE